jgi:hypothetical protein
MQPPRPAAVTHGKLSYYACFNFRRQRPKPEIVQSPAAHLNPSVPSVHLPRLQRLPGSSVATVLLLFDDNEALMPRQRNFDTEPPCSCCHEFQPDHRLETPLTRTPPPICTFAPGSQTALIWRAVGAANDYRNTLWVTSDNPPIGPIRLSLRQCCRIAIAKLESKFLNPRIESRASGVVTNLAGAAKNFHKKFTFDRTEAIFQTACGRYVDK